MKHVVRSVVALLTGLITFGCSDSQTSPRMPQTPSYSFAGSGRRGFSFEGDIKVAATGQTIHLTGGGSFDPSTASSDEPSGHGNGSFGCNSDFSTTLFAGCLTGQGVRWDTEQMLPSSTFNCGTVGEKGKTATTSEDVIVLSADFYRAGDGINESFRAKMFVSNGDLADDVDGIQNVWIQTVGCGTATVHFSN